MTYGLGKEALSIRGATKRYARREVLKGVNLSIKKGEVHGLIGPNGSGKSTLIKCITGAEKLSSGDIELNGARITTLSPAARIRRGMAVKFQQVSIVRDLTVHESIRFALGPRRSIFSWLWQRDVTLARELAVMDLLHLSDRASVSADQLSHGEQQWLELAIALASSPELLLLDEPTAGMSVIERSQTEAILREIADSERTILLVDHDLDFVKRFCDSITVLNDGQIVRSGPTELVAKDPAVHRVYLGGSES